MNKIIVGDKAYAVAASASKISTPAKSKINMTALLSVIITLIVSLLDIDPAVSKKLLLLVAIAGPFLTIYFRTYKTIPPELNDSINDLVDELNGATHN